MSCLLCVSCMVRFQIQLWTEHIASCGQLPAILSFSRSHVALKISASSRFLDAQSTSASVLVPHDREMQSSIQASSGAGEGGKEEALTQAVSRMEIPECTCAWPKFNVHRVPSILLFVPSRSGLADRLFVDRDASRRWRSRCA